MDRLPDELLLHIIQLLDTDIRQLLIINHVSKSFNRVSQDPKLWYSIFKAEYSIWGKGINYTAHGQHLINWKKFVIHLAKLKKETGQFTFNFVDENEHLLKDRKRKIENEEGSYHRNLCRQRIGSNYNENTRYAEDTVETPFWIQDPLVVDIDSVTKTGIVATGKHRRNLNGLYHRSEHKIMFWEYPSWNLKRVFELNLSPPSLTCQIVGLQSIRIMDPSDQLTHKIRFFTVVVGRTFFTEMEGDTVETEDRVDIWNALFVYRLFDDGSTQCVAHIEVPHMFLGTEVFLFSDSSWCQSNDGDEWQPDPTTGKLRDWMQILSPENADYDPYHTVFILAVCPITNEITGCIQLARFDLRTQENILDPSLVPVIWDDMLNYLIPLHAYHSIDIRFPRTLSPSTDDISYPSHHKAEYMPPTTMITAIKLGEDLSCIIHFKYPPCLNHLVCAGSYQDTELSVYDWRFGVKVGTIPWKTMNKNNAHLSHDMDMMDVHPWGLEFTLVIPTDMSPEIHSTDIISHYGFRLIAVGDNRNDDIRGKLEIKVWDISYLLRVKWDPLSEDEGEDIADDYKHLFQWWDRGTKRLKQLAMRMICEEDELSILPMHMKYDPSIVLPYSPSTEFQSLLLTHAFDKDEANDVPVKYTAYNVLHTSLFLLTEDGKVTIVDIETGEMTNTIDSMVGSNKEIGPVRQIRGLDINVIGGHEVVITSKEGVLRAVVS